MSAVREALAAEGADPVDILKAVQAVLAADAAGEATPCLTDSDDAPADMSAESDDEEGATFESAGEGWLRSDGRGRSRSEGADPLRRNRDRSPRLSETRSSRLEAAARRPGRGRSAAPHTAGRTMRADSQEL